MNQYSVLLGGVLCRSCGASEPSAIPIAVDVLKLLRVLQRADRLRDASIRVPDAVMKSTERLLRRQLEHVLERKLRAAEFVHRVAEDRPAFSSQDAGDEAATYVSPIQAGLPGGGMS
jgi:hypothetical protein